MHYIVLFLFMAWLVFGFASIFVNYHYKKKEKKQYRVDDMLADLLLGPIGSIMSFKLYDPTKKKGKK